MLENLKKLTLTNELRDYLKKNKCIGVYFYFDENGNVQSINFNSHPKM